MNSPTTHRSFRSAALGGAAASTVLALTGCGLINSLTGSDSAFNLQVGDCIAESVGYTEVSNVETVDCNEPHYSEVYASIIMEDGPFPGDAVIQEEATVGCEDAFFDFVGIDWLDSELDYEVLFPIEESWNELDDREILCMVYDPVGDTVGTLADAAI